MRRKLLLALEPSDIPFNFLSLNFERQKSIEYVYLVYLVLTTTISYSIYPKEILYKLLHFRFVDHLETPVKKKTRFVPIRTESKPFTNAYILYLLLQG